MLKCLKSTTVTVVGRRMLETSQPQEDSEDTWKKDGSTVTGPTHIETASGPRHGEETWDGSRGVEVKNKGQNIMC